MRVDFETPIWSKELTRGFKLLESDSSNRADSMLIAEGSFAEADRIKAELEEGQRRDKALRQGSAK